MKLCKHIPHKVFTHILDPKYSTNEVLIDVKRVSPEINHYIIRFSSEGARNKWGWFHLSGKDIRNSKKQANGRGEVYAVSMGKSVPFTPEKDCSCANLEFDLFK